MNILMKTFYFRHQDSNISQIVTMEKRDIVMQESSRSYSLPHSYTHTKNKKGNGNKKKPMQRTKRVIVVPDMVKGKKVSTKSLTHFRKSKWTKFRFALPTIF